MGWGSTLTTTVSTVPACLSALVAAARHVFPDPATVQVVDGQPVRYTGDDIICIGFTSDPGEVAVQNTLTREQMATDPDRESYDVTCLAGSWRGETDDPVPARERVFELINTLAAYLARDPTLGGVVARTRISAQALVQEQTTKGATATVVFTVHVDAFTR